MGTIRNEMTIVHHYDKDELEEVRKDAIKFFSEIVSKDLGNFNIYAIDSMISPIMTTYINGEYTFIINGDCSKIGWGTSELFHEARMKWCEKHKYDVQNIIVINFGEDDEPCHIVFDNKTQKVKVEHCKNCKYFEYDSVAKIDGVSLIVAHEICKRWGDGCKTSEDGYCFLFESKESEK